MRYTLIEYNDGNAYPNEFGPYSSNDFKKNIKHHANGVIIYRYSALGEQFYFPETHPLFNAHFIRHIRDPQIKFPTDLLLQLREVISKELDSITQ